MRFRNCGLPSKQPVCCNRRGRLYLCGSEERNKVEAASSRLRSAAEQRLSAIANGTISESQSTQFAFIRVPKIHLMTKSTVEQIRQRFDKDVERFSNLETGQSATIDAPLVLDLIAKAATAAKPDAKHLLDIGCGAGNYTLKFCSLFRFQRSL